MIKYTLFLEFCNFIIHTLIRSKIEGYCCTKEAIMGRSLSITMTILCLLFMPAPLFAQNPPFNLNYQSGILLEKITLLQHDTLNPQIASLSPFGLPPIGYRELLAAFIRPSFSLLKDEDLIYACWQDLKTMAARLKNATVNREVFNALYNKPWVDEKKLLRQVWKKTFGGVDVWYPYFKVKEVEDWVKEKMSVRFWGFKGKPRFGEDKFIYVFRKTF